MFFAINKFKYFDMKKINENKFQFKKMTILDLNQLKSIKGGVDENTGGIFTDPKPKPEAPAPR